MIHQRATQFWETDCDTIEFANDPRDNHWLIGSVDNQMNLRAALQRLVRRQLSFILDTFTKSSINSKEIIQGQS